MDDGELWGEASVSFPDRSGTAQLDERKTLPWKGLLGAVGLDGEQWEVLGFDIGGGEHGYELRIIATPRDVWEKAAAGDAEIEATEFLVHDVDPLAILRQMMHVFELRMRGSEGQAVRIRSRSDLPAELFVDDFIRTAGLSIGHRGAGRHLSASIPAPG
ncbi:hypothetical protein ACQP2X_39755 [Actinoplanes sp. CA-131856]